MNALNFPPIIPPSPGTVCCWMVITPDARRSLWLDHMPAVDYAAWQHGQVFALVMPEAEQEPQ